MKKNLYLIVRLTTYSMMFHGIIDTSTPTTFRNHFIQKYAHILENNPNLTINEQNSQNISKSDLERQTLANIYDQLHQPTLDFFGNITNACGLTAAMLYPALQSQKTRLIKNPVMAGAAAFCVTAMAPRTAALCKYHDQRNEFINQNYIPSENEKIITELKQEYAHVPANIMQSLCPLNKSLILDTCDNIQE